MTSKKTPEPTVSPESIATATADISRLVIEEKIAKMENEYKSVLQQRDKMMADAKQLDVYALRLEGAIQSHRDLLAPPKE